MAFTETLKSEVRKKSHMCCCLCKALGVEVHHIVPQSEGGSDEKDNAAPLCPSCHEIYGANPLKRKFIKEARDSWYEICEKRYASDEDKIDEIKDIVRNTVSREDLDSFKEEILARFNIDFQGYRTEKELLNAVDEFCDKIWYDRHQLLKTMVESGKKEVHPEIWEGALKAAQKMEKRYLKKELGPWDEFEWGMLNGKLSALRWMLGEDWDMLDT